MHFSLLGKTGMVKLWYPFSMPQMVQKTDFRSLRKKETKIRPIKSRSNINDRQDRNI